MAVVGVTNFGWRKNVRMNSQLADNFRRPMAYLVTAEVGMTNFGSGRRENVRMKSQLADSFRRAMA